MSLREFLPPFVCLLRVCSLTPQIMAQNSLPIPNKYLFRNFILFSKYRLKFVRNLDCTIVTTPYIYIYLLGFGWVRDHNGSLPLSWKIGQSLLCSFVKSGVSVFSALFYFCFCFFFGEGGAQQNSLSESSDPPLG